MIRLRVLGVREGLITFVLSRETEQYMLMLVSFLLFMQSKILAWANSMPSFERVPQLS